MNFFQTLAEKVRGKYFSGDPGDGTSQKVYREARNLMKQMESDYRREVRRLGGRTRARGLLRIRLFALNFPLSAMTLAQGEAKQKAAQAVYGRLLRAAYRGLALDFHEKQTLARTQLEEQSRSLVSEARHVGAGQYALASIYETALKDAVPELEHRVDRLDEPLAGLLGRHTGECLAVWARLYQEISGRPLQVYTEGFQPTERDSRRLSE